MSIAFRIRSNGKVAAAKQLEAWKIKHAQAMLAYEVDDLINEAVMERDNDKRMIDQLVRRVSDSNTESIDKLNDSIQSFCDHSIKYHDTIRSLLAIVKKMGHVVENEEALDRVTNEYRKWKEDYPDILAASAKRSLLQKRIKEARQDVTRESDWREILSDC